MKNIVMLCIVMILSGCNVQSEAETAYSNITESRVWVFTHFNVPAEGGALESYYYYGSVSESLYNAIGRNELKGGFIQLKEISFWGDGDLIYDYKDREHSGDRIFRIEHIASIRQIPSRPISGKGVEQFNEVDAEEESAKITETK
tara:strand:- start:94 stop:528 length:435 start_codon:yes stop_codon:yes gene_type:complete